MKASGAPSRRLGAIIALEAEAAAILADGRFSWAEDGPGEFSSGSYPLRLALCGVGKAFASWACARLAPRLERGRDLLVSLGTSGGLSKEKVGSLRLVGEFVEYDMDASGLGFERGLTPFSGAEEAVIRSLSPWAEELAAKALEASGRRADWARAASGDRFIQDAGEASALREATGASIVDMESAAIAKLCAFRGHLDFLALRYVSDNADHAAMESWTSRVADASLDFDAFLFELARLSRP